RERFMNYLEEQTDGEAMINSIQNGDHPFPVVTQVSLAGTTPNAIPTLKDPKFWTAKEKKTRKIVHLARSLLIQRLPNNIYSLVDSNKTAKDLWDALERQMCGSKYGEQDRKAAILYEYETFKATGGEQLLDTYLRYLQVINDLKKCGYKKDNYVNDALGYKKKAVVVTSDPLALVAKKTKVSKRKEKVEVQTESEGSDDEDISDLKKITALLAKAFNQKKFYAKPTNNNLRTSSASSSANKKPEYVKSIKKKEDKKDDEKKRGMSKVKCYNCKKEGHFAKDCKKEKVKDYNYYKIKMFLAKKDSDEQVLLVEDQAWMESSSDFDQEINANMVFMAKIEKILLDSNESSSSAEETIAETVQIFLWIIDSGCSKHMTSNRALLTNFVEKFLGTVRFGNNDFAVIAGYGDVVIGLMTIKKVYYVNLFSVGQFCDKGLEVAFRKCACFVRTEDGVDLLTETSSAYVCNDAMNVSYNSRFYDSFDVNNLFIFDDESVKNSQVSKMPFRKKPNASLNVPFRSKLNKSLPRIIVQIFLWIIDSGCSKHMTGNRALLTNFVEKFLGTVCFGNNDFAVIAGYGDVVIGSMAIKKVYYGLEVAFRKSACFVRTEDGVDLLTGDRSSNLYTIALNKFASNYSACLLAKASSSQSWLWHQRLSHLNFATINNLVKNNRVQGLPKTKFKKDHLCSTCEQGKIHRKHHKSKTAFASNKPLYLL
nr:hypothetical protein [Tanacetum cinerariifolium]